MDIIPSGKLTWCWGFFFTGYDGQGDWNMYSRYMNLDGGMAHVSTSFLLLPDVVMNMHLCYIFIEYHSLNDFDFDNDDV